MLANITPQLENRDNDTLCMAALSQSPLQPSPSELQFHKIEVLRESSILLKEHDINTQTNLATQLINKSSQSLPGISITQLSPRLASSQSSTPPGPYN